MTTVEQLARLQVGSVTAPPVEYDPFVDEDALYDAQILDLRLDALRDRLAILLESRTAMNYDGDTGLLVVHGLTHQTWDSEERANSRTAWTVVSSIPSTVDGALSLYLGAMPDLDLRIRASRAAFYVGNVGLPDEIPDYGEATDADLTRMLAQWDSEFELVGASFFNVG